jgi:SAM-dependent methyltransferase
VAGLTDSNARTSPDWASIALPAAWPDKLNLLRPRDLLLFLRRVLGPRRPVELPEALPGRETLPAYLLQEFHHLPNGTYSNRIAGAYAVWFDRAMLGVMAETRRQLARDLAGCEPVLDAGCGGGGLARALRAQGSSEVWGLDPCPYLLKWAAERSRGVRYLQGLAESSYFAPESLGGIGACFLFHELPPAIADCVLKEFHRILRPGGVLAFAEPAPHQLEMQSVRELFRAGGLRALYFGALARLVHEPAVKGWHDRDVRPWLTDAGFEVLRDTCTIPVRIVVARKRDQAGEPA